MSFCHLQRPYFIRLSPFFTQTYKSTPYSSSTHLKCPRFPLAPPAGEGNLRFDDFVELMGESRRATSYKDEMRAVFRAFDKDDDGLITAEDIRETMKVFPEFVFVYLQGDSQGIPL